MFNLHHFSIGSDIIACSISISYGLIFLAIISHAEAGQISGWDNDRAQGGLHQWRIIRHACEFSDFHYGEQEWSRIEKSRISWPMFCVCRQVNKPLAIETGKWKLIWVVVKNYQSARGFQNLVVRVVWETRMMCIRFDYNTRERELYRGTVHMYVNHDGVHIAMSWGVCGCCFLLTTYSLQLILIRRRYLGRWVVCVLSIWKFVFEFLTISLFI